MTVAALQFSGGRDSLALVMYMRAFWNEIEIVFMDSGDATEHALERVDVVKKMVPHFTHLKSDSVAYRKEHGDPDSVSWVRCCMANIYGPMHAYVKSKGFRQILRGTKAVDPHLHFTLPGDVVDGILYTFPLWNWTDRDVDAYLGDALAEPYKRGAIGMPDCKTCPVAEICGGTTRKLWNDAPTLGLH